MVAPDPFLAARRSLLHPCLHACQCSYFVLTRYNTGFENREDNVEVFDVNLTAGWSRDPKPSSTPSAIPAKAGIQWSKGSGGVLDPRFRGYRVHTSQTLGPAFSNCATCTQVIEFRAVGAPPFPSLLGKGARRAGWAAEGNGGSRRRSCNPTWVEAAGHTPSGAPRHLPQQAGEGEPSRDTKRRRKPSAQ